MLEILPAAVYAVDAEGRITYFNRKAAELWGRAPQLLDHDERFCGSFRLWLPDGRHLPHAETPMALALRGGGSVRDLEVVIERPDGARVPVRVNIDPLLDERGAIRGAVNVFVDSAARAVRETALRHSEERYRSLVAATAAVVWTADEAGAFATPQASWERYTGQPWEEHRGFGWADKLHPDDRPRIVEEWRAVVRARTGYETHGRVWHAASGTYRYFEVRAVPVVEPTGEVREWVGVIHDVQERREAELALAAAREAAEAASRAKDEFLALLSHELKNPLAPILTALRLLKLRGDEAAAKEHAVIERQVVHVTRLVDDLLDVSRIVRGRIELRRAVVRAADVIAQAIEMATPLIEHRGHRLEVELPAADGGDAWIDVDATRFAQVVSNLLTNAAKYTPPGGRIQLVATEADGEVSVTVRDDGIGLPPEALDRIWAPFFQIGRSVEQAQGGLGLGLALVKSLTELHGGRVAARSEGVDRGAEFVVTVPVASAARRAKADSEPPVAATDALAPARIRRVLVVDDNGDSADTIADYLRDLGHEVTVAYDPPQALAAARTFRFDVALVDIGLPVMDGYELAARLRGEAEQRPVRIFAFTGYGQDAIRQRAEAAGFDGCFTKPLDPDVIARAVVE